MFRSVSRVVGASIGASAACRTATPQATPNGVGVPPQARLQSSGSGKKRDYYEVLGVSRGASESDLKKAYRKRAMATHPDKGGDKEEFAAVSEAYECLSSPDKRRAYDQFGHEAANMGGMGGMGGHRSAEDIFADFFRSAGMGGGMGGGGQPAQVEDVDVKLTATLEDIFSGVTKSVRVRRPAVCGECRGEGTKQPGQKVNCKQCGGSGRVVQRVQMGPGMVQQVVSHCNACDGAGKTIRPEDRCTKCRGEGYTITSESVSISVPAGVPEGAVMVMQGAGGEKPNMAPGNLNVHIEVLPHRTFKRRGDDLILEKTVSLVEALTGVHMRVALPDGRTVVVKSEEGKPLKHNGVLAVMHEGMPKYQRGGRGHLYVVTKVNMPSNLTTEQREALEKVFGKAHREEPGTKTITAKQLSESFQELEQAKAADWSRGGGGHGGSGGGSRRRGGQSQEAQCQQM
uniref:J domain-containing protein n=1 Tax=Neobodo designis TaxID=312471 RepID=A0A7S1QYY0_NEODS|mmetsp:Transcript_54934/g.169316  ORF Transcript_54934/g.169316 Transcript_54934/m.169316 type:complete len:457 (+) Transcript_54934:39-1409(+)